jgi:hypothetical protein
LPIDKWINEIHKQSAITSEVREDSTPVHGALQTCSSPRRFYRG